MSWAQVALDRQFSLEVTIPEGHRLVTGPYRLLRHPRYLGMAGARRGGATAGRVRYGSATRLKVTRDCTPRKRRSTTAQR